MKTVGKYEILGLLGRGGMSRVYKARLPVVNKIVALKLLVPHPHLVHILGEEEINRRFISEVLTSAALRHPNIVDVLDFDYADGCPFFIMEYYYRNLGTLMGESYRVESPSRILWLDKAIHYARQILLGVSRLHRAGVVHRDIKPFNLLITDEDQIKISDFGLSKLRGETYREPSQLMVGSPWYAAPEQELDPEGVDARADLYSVGVIFYRMLTGGLPEEETVKPSECHPDADAAWDEFVFRAIERDRERRFSSGEQMLRELEQLKTAWEEKKRNACVVHSTPSPPRTRHGSSVASLRSVPVKVRPNESYELFCCDSLWRPVEYVENDFHVRDGERTVLDRSTGLLWQESGAEDPLDWHGAREYAESLNAGCFAAHSNWRLPTVNELFSLLKPLGHRDEDCLEGPFDPGKKWLWSSDRRSFVSAWYVDSELGFASWGDYTCRFFVRLVCEYDGHGTDANRS